MTAIAITTAAITATIGGVVGFLFRQIEKKIDHMEQENEHRHKEQVEIRIAERELLLAEANISALTARCVRGEKVNGDLEAAEKNLREKKTAVQDLTRRLALEYAEEARP